MLISSAQRHKRIFYTFNSHPHSYQPALLCLLTTHLPSSSGFRFITCTKMYYCADGFWIVTMCYVHRFVFSFVHSSCNNQHEIKKKCIFWINFGSKLTNHSSSYSLLKYILTYCRLHPLPILIRNLPISILSRLSTSYWSLLSLQSSYLPSLSNRIIIPTIILTSLVSVAHPSYLLGTF